MKHVATFYFYFFSGLKIKCINFFFLWFLEIILLIFWWITVGKKRKKIRHRDDCCGKSEWMKKMRKRQFMKCLKYYYYDYRHHLKVVTIKYGCLKKERILNKSTNVFISELLCNKTNSKLTHTYTIQLYKCLFKYLNIRKERSTMKTLCCIVEKIIYSTISCFFFHRGFNIYFHFTSYLSKYFL